MIDAQWHEGKRFKKPHTAFVIKMNWWAGPARAGGSPTSTQPTPRWAMIWPAGVRCCDNFEMGATVTVAHEHLVSVGPQGHIKLKIFGGKRLKRRKKEGMKGNGKGLENETKRGNEMFWEWKKGNERREIKGGWKMERIEGK